METEDRPKPEIKIPMPRLTLRYECMTASIAKAFPPFRIGGVRPSFVKVLMTKD
jgi:hypothetical protein